jgi:hypothetical protein
VVPGAVGDAPPLVVTPLYYGTVGTNGWYTSNVVVNWDIQPKNPPYTSNGCDGVALTETGGTRITCTAVNADGAEFRVTTKLIKIDKTPPSVAAAASRAPDANGWYNHALSVAFSGTDALSGIAGCSIGSYAGPDNGGASVPGSCTDMAGNVGTAAFPLAYDATPPSVSRLRWKAGNRRVDLLWAASADTQLVQVTRTKGSETATVYSGKAASYRDSRLQVGAKYRYTVTAFDQAGNSASSTLAVTATGALLSPVPGAQVGSAPILRWTPVKGARYYNIQLLRGRTVLSAWPTSPHFKVPRSWVFKGHRYRLHKGTYRWYVWPGFGRFSASRYGRLLGGSSFVFSG